MKSFANLKICQELLILQSRQAIVSECSRKKYIFLEYHTINKKECSCEIILTRISVEFNNYRLPRGLVLLFTKNLQALLKLP